MVTTARQLQVLEQVVLVQGHGVPIEILPWCSLPRVGGVIKQTRLGFRLPGRVPLRQYCLVTTRHVLLFALLLY